MSDPRIISGNIDTGTNTPTGAKMKVAVDNPYVSKADFVRSLEAKGVGMTENSPEYANGELDRILLEASSWVNRICGRWFDQQTIDEQKTAFTVRPYNPQLVTVVLQNRPYARINSVNIQVLQWFIPVIVSGPGSYLQDFYDKGFYKIVPLLSTSGTGVGSPIPAAILDHVPLGVLWTNYTFGFGQVLAGLTLNHIGSTKQYQAKVGYQLWAPDQPKTVYDNGVVVDPANYEIDYPNGMVTFATGHAVTGPVTIDVTTNESLPFDIKKAAILIATHIIGQASQNPMGAGRMSIQTYSIDFGEESAVLKRAKQLLEPYVDKRPGFLGL